MKVKAPTGSNLRKAYKEGCSDVKKTLELLYPDFFKKEETFKRGERIMVDKYECIIAVLPDTKKHLIVDLRDGCHWGGTFKPKDFTKISKKELESSMVTNCKIDKLS